MIDGLTIAIVAICITLIVHLVATIWWAAKLTNRVDHIEKWITSNERMAERLIAIETKVDLILRKKDDAE